MSIDGETNGTRVVLLAMAHGIHDLQRERFICTNSSDAITILLSLQRGVDWFLQMKVGKTLWNSTRWHCILQSFGFFLCDMLTQRDVIMFEPV